MAKGELHIQLVLDYADDPKLEGVSRGARLLYIDGIIKARQLKSDGFISNVQVEKLAHPDVPSRARKQAAELVMSGAWEQHNGGYVITGYLKRNPSKAQIDAMMEEASEAGVRGNHERWHKDRISPNCPLCPGEEPSPTDQDPIGVPDGDPNRGRIRGESGSDPISSPETETETETETEEPKEIVAFRADVELICTALRDRMIGNGCKPPTITDTWRNAARLLLDKDNRAYEEVLHVLDWSQSDRFWRKNIHSLPTFREKYDKLRLGAQESAQSGSSNMDGFAALIQKFEAQRIGGAQ